MRTFRFARQAAGFLIAAFSLMSAVQAGELPVPNESLVTAQRDLIDPEYSQSRAQMIWCDKDGSLWIANVNRDTGLFQPSDGKGKLIDADAMATADFKLVTNGPEWVSTAYGDQIVYTKFVTGQPHTLANARLGLAWRLSSGAWSLSMLSPNLARSTPYASANAGDPEPTISYIDPYGNHYWRNLYDASSETQVPIYQPSYKFALRLGEGPRVAAFVAPVNGVQQVFIYWLDTNDAEQITFDNGQKDLHSRPWIWQAPEYDGALVMTTVADDTELRVYRLPPGGSNTDWQLIDSVSTPDHGVINSPEHFTYNGKSYVFFGASTGSESYPSTIFLTGIDASSPSLQQLTPALPDRVRSDPEVFMANDGPYIYYNRGTVPASSDQRTCLACNEGIFRTYTWLSPAQ